jgi:hypothetical protein
MITPAATTAIITPMRVIPRWLRIALIRVSWTGFRPPRRELRRIVVNSAGAFRKANHIIVVLQLAHAGRSRRPSADKVKSMMGAFGRFLELSIPVRDIRRSLAFYHALGFVELTAGDIRTWHYAVVTDGTIVLGLHAAAITEPSLAFVRPNLERQVQAMELAGHRFEFRRLGADEFHEAGLRSPDGHMILMLEARTFSPGTDSGSTSSIIGHCTEVSLGCVEPETTRQFFETAGFLPAPTAGSRPDVCLEAPGIRIGLRSPSSRQTLRFAPDDMTTALERLAAAGIEPVRAPEGVSIDTPEGLRLLLAK